MIKDLCFEIIETCPNNCMFCSSNSSIEKKRIIEFETFKKTVDYLMKKYGIKEISLSGGEPLLHPDIFKMIEYCKSLNIRVVLFTSGIKIKKSFTKEEERKLEKHLRNYYASYIKEGMDLIEFESLIKKLMKRYIAVNNEPFTNISTEEFKTMEKLGLDKIVFDFQCWDKEKYNKIMGTTKCHDALITSIAKSSQYNIKKDAHFIPTKINYKELPDIIEILNYAHFETLSILNFVPQGRGNINKKELEMTEKEYEKFIAIYNKEKEKFKGKIRIGRPLLNQTHTCTAGFTKLVIKYDGTVLPCSAFKETNLELLNNLGFTTPNIMKNIEELELKTESQEIPLCRRLYNFNQKMK